MTRTLPGTPAADGFRMPGEFELHAGCWMLWPERPDAAAALGNLAGINDVGAVYQNGHGVRQNYAIAMKWYRKAAAGGFALAMANLGQMYYFGFGLTKDYKIAFQWFSKAAKAGNDIGMSKLGIMYAKGQYVAENSTKALYWLQKAARLGNQEAQQVLRYNNLTW